MKYILFLLSLIVLSGCSDSDRQNIKLDEEEQSKLVMAASDMYFIDTWIARTTLSQKDSLRIKLKKEFSQIHNQSTEEVKEKLLNIQADPKLYAKVMDSIVVRLKNTQSLKK